MSSLTESSLIFNGDEPPKQSKSDWVGLVYLCVEKKNTSAQITNGFNCYAFIDYNKAYAYCKKNMNNKENKHTMIPVCKWIPLLFHKQYLNYKLKKFYWNNNITIFRNQRYI